MLFHRMCDSPMLTLAATRSVVAAIARVVRRALQWLAYADLSPRGFQPMQALCASVPPSLKTTPFVQEC